MCICPTKAILPTGTLMPNSSNLSTNMIQSKKIQRHTGMTFYNNNIIASDKFIGTIQYIKKISFYYKSSPISFYELNWNSFGSTYEESIQIAAIYLTLLSNKKIPNSVLFPFFIKDNLVYALGIQNGNIIHYKLNPSYYYYYAYIKD